MSEQNFGGLDMSDILRAADGEETSVPESSGPPVPDGFEEWFEQPEGGEAPSPKRRARNKAAKQPVKKHGAGGETHRKAARPAGGKSSAGVLDTIPRVFDWLPCISTLLRAVCKARIGLLIWIALNILCTVCIVAICVPDGRSALLMGLFLYFLGLLLMVSPCGELILRLENGWKPLKSESQDVFNQAQPILEEVFEKAREECRFVRSMPVLCVSYDDSPDAFAVGRHTICVTSGLIEKCSADELRGILANSFGHIANRDGDDSLAIFGGNIFISIFLTLVGIFVGICVSLLGGNRGNYKDSLAAKIQGFIQNGLMTAWIWLGLVITRVGTEKKEFAADSFAAKIGYGAQLCDVLTYMEEDSNQGSGLWRHLASCRPPIADRIMRLNGADNT